jgi:hypothetical protein
MLIITHVSRCYIRDNEIFLFLGWSYTFSKSCSSNSNFVLCLCCIFYIKKLSIDFIQFWVEVNVKYSECNVSTLRLMCKACKTTKNSRSRLVKILKSIRDVFLHVWPGTDRRIESYGSRSDHHLRASGWSQKKLYI